MNSNPVWESVERLDALELRPDAKNRFYGRSASSSDYSGLTYIQRDYWKKSVFSRQYILEC